MYSVHDVIDVTFQQWAVSSDSLQECRKCHANLSLRGKEHLQEDPELFLSSDGVCGHLCNEENKEETEQPEQDGADQLTGKDASQQWFCHKRGEIHDCRNVQHHRTEVPCLHGDPVPNIKIISITGQLKPSLVTEATLPGESFISEVPLRLQIQVCGQRGGLGISIAGGKGSLPYKGDDEGVFISQVSAGGPSAKEGIHVGDRLVEVNGLSLQGATHHVAVSALRNAGSCINVKVLREEIPGVARVPKDQSLKGVTSGQQCSLDGGEQRQSKEQRMKSSADCLSKNIEAFVCNGNGISGPKWTLSEWEAGTLMTNEALKPGRSTMKIPRIILTHPSVSDEDVELLTPNRGTPNREASGDSHIHSDSLDCAFYPP
ncbi:uncharacterized protein LOC143012719 [Genypterus blacodes]|uniref:uncharacterized protein LOC143012719 n=1 Tax=Genypterus blacodes TaxID=154954 RepID=UPI003F7627F9